MLIHVGKLKAQSSSIQLNPVRLVRPRRHRKHTHRCASKLFDVQVNARELGCPALFEAAAAARREVEAVAARPD